MRIIGQIQYENKDGNNVHSDLIGDPTDPEYRKFLHDNLDEWLDNAHLHKQPFYHSGTQYLAVEPSTMFYVFKGSDK